MTLAILLVAAVGHAQIPCGGYEVTAIIAGPDCGPPGLGAVLPYAINEAGDVAGFFICPVLADHAFLWTASAGLQTIPMPPGTTQSRAFGIDGTQVVGYHVVSGDEFGNLAFLYDTKTGEFTNLGTFPGGDWSEAFAVEQGVVVGFAGNTVMGDPPLEAFIYQDGVMVNLGEDLGTPSSRARDIANGMVTGWMGESSIFDGNAYIWDQRDVITLPPIPDGFTSSGWAINNLQDVAGRGRMVDPRTGETVKRAFARIDSKMILLGTLPGFPDSTATGMNDSRVATGFSQSNFPRSFVWSQGVLVDLNDLISPDANLTIQVARGINQAGQITAVADSNDLNATVGLVLTPVEGPPGDLDGDCVVGILDLLTLLPDWGPCPPMADCPADLNEDGIVNIFDLLLLLANWG
ncbi:MAG: hypothetical protein IH830_12350 [Planctomycetes bacterium]|nr:hypothetical protein [Planctomycetota bacterium]